MSSKAVVRMIKILNFTNISQVAVGKVYFFYSMRLPRASLVTLFLWHLPVDINNQLDILNLSIQERNQDLSFQVSSAKIDQAGEQVMRMMIKRVCVQVKFVMMLG